ncbi:MAG: histidine kinase N-terminal 7TM domain-containing protein, partial [Cyclobacteriaceae bacterium]
MEINVFSILLVLIPLVLNLILGFFIYMKLPADKKTNLFLLFLLSLIFWQLEELLIRLKISTVSKYVIDGYLSVGWIFLGAFLLHFTIHLVHSRIRKERLFYLINYGVTLGFYLLYINHPEPIAFNYHAFFGDIPVVRPGTLDFYKRLWIVGQVYYALFLMGVYIHRNKGKSKNEKRVSQVKWVFAGVSIPALAGFFTQFFLPLFDIEDIAITASSMTAISVCTFIGMTRSSLFNFLEFVSVDEIMRDMKAVLVMFDKDLNVFMKNDYTNTLLSIEQEHEINFGDFLSEKSKKNLEEAMLEKGEISKANFLELNVQKHNKIALEYSLHQTGQFGDTQLYLLFGNDVSERFTSRQRLKAFNRYFKYFLEASNESFFELDPFTGEIHWNETEFKIFGKDKM